MWWQLLLRWCMPGPGIRTRPRARGRSLLGCWTTGWAWVTEGYWRGPAAVLRRSGSRRVFLRRFHYFITTEKNQRLKARIRETILLQQIQGSAEHYPLNAILISLSQGLPYSFFLGSFSCDANSGAPAVRAGGILLYLPEFDSLWRNIVACIREVEHTPESSIRIRLGHLEKRKIG